MRNSFLIILIALIVVGGASYTLPSGVSFGGTVLVNDSFSFLPEGYVSVFALSERAEGVTLSGLKYTLTDATLTNDYPIGVSNEGMGERATVSVRSGALYLLFEGNTLPL